MTRHALGMQGRINILARSNPAAIAALAYAAYIAVGSVLLWLPFSKDASSKTAISFVDALFVSASAVSTTGLSTLDPANTFSFTGELIILLLLQIGGLGYMAFMSFAYLGLQDRLGPTQSRLNRSAFGLPAHFNMAQFVRRVIGYTLIIETIGAVILSILFMQAGVDDAIWQGIFHSVSAFCTAGFSLFPTGLEMFQANNAVLLTISALAYMGAIGFVVMAELQDRLLKGKPVSVTSRLIIKVTVGLALAGTIFFYFFEPAITALPQNIRLQNAFFQTMTASTTVGFNSMAVGTLAPASIIVLYLLMFVGASPSGTGGGLKSTTAATLAALVWDVLRGHKVVTLSGITIPSQRVHQAAASLCIALLVIFFALIFLDITGDYAFDKSLFEVISALANVGLSMGLTSELNTAGKLIFVLVMYIGRVGILTFFAAFAAVADDDDEKKPDGDIIL